MDINGLGIINEGTLKAMGVALMACMLRVIVTKSFSFWSILRKAFICLVVGVFALPIVQYIGVEGTLVYSVVGFICLIAEEVAVVGINIGKEFRKNPMGALGFIKYLIGKK